MKRRLGYLSLLVLSGLLAANITGCGHAAMPGEPAMHGSSDNANPADQGAMDSVVAPPQEYYAALLARHFDNLTTAGLTGSGPTATTLFVNFDGVTVDKGYDVTKSFLLCKAQAIIPASGFSPTERDTILKEVQDYYDKAGAQLNVTDKKPAVGEYTTINVGGSYGDLGCLDNPGVLGIAPFDVGNADHSDIGFVFVKYTTDLKTVGISIAHEAGHTFGLDHVDSPSDVMHASANDQITGFGVGRVVGSAISQDEPKLLQAVLGQGAGTTTSAPGPAAPAGPASIANMPNIPATLANLPGLSTIGGLGKLIPGLDPSNVLDISGILSQLQTLMPNGVNGLTNLDKALTVIQMAGAAANKQAGATPVPAGAASNPISAVSGILSGALSNTSTASTVAGLATLAGQPEIGALIMILQPVLANASQNASTHLSNGTAAPTAIGALPNLNQMISLPTYQNMAGLLSNLDGHAQVINANFSGTTQTALLSMLKVAYAQAYAQSLTH